MVLALGAGLAYRLTRKPPQELVIPDQDTNQISEQPTETPKQETPEQKPSDKSASGDKPSGSENPQSSVAPKEPTGAFVSNHRPSMGASPKLVQVQSTCNTTPGATCTITFTKDSLIRTLPAKPADSNGNVFWSWSTKDAKLTQGVWKITATAKLNGHTKTAADVINLEVQP